MLFLVRFFSDTWFSSRVNNRKRIFAIFDFNFRPVSRFLKKRAAHFAILNRANLRCLNYNNYLHSELFDVRITSQLCQDRQGNF